MIAENLKNLQNRIVNACASCGRRPEEIKLVAVSKTFAAQQVREAVEVGQMDFGENYVQELLEKREQLPGLSPRWHFIGHLQSNKAKFIVPFVHLIHSVDDVDVAREIDKRAARLNRMIDVLVEVRTTDEATKYGVQPDKAVDIVRQVARLENVRVAGLMTMGPFSDDPNDARPSFRTVMELKREIEREGIDRVSMRHLSMGMSHDFEVAIEEGSTMLRIGTAIFGKRANKTT